MLTAIIVVFVLGYLAIALEHQLKINKAASALLIGAVCWTLYAVDFQNLVPAGSVPHWFSEHATEDGVSAADMPRHYLTEGQLLHLTGEIAYILFFLMGAMTIVELVDAHEGFSIITSRIKARKISTLLWVVGWMTFFLSAVLDNLTTTIVMISLLRKLIADRPTRLLFAGIVVIAANAGGAWTVIGDVTTTMLWIKHKIAPWEVMRDLFLPSVACLLVPLIVLSRFMTGELKEVPEERNGEMEKGIRPWHRMLFLVLGLGGLVSVPVFKAYTHLPPFMGMMLALAILWFVSEMISHTLDEPTRTSTGVLAVLKRVDMSTILFFLGILLAVGSLAATGALGNLAKWVDSVVPNRDIVAVLIGLVSAVVDNVPLVAAGIEMYTMPINDRFWMLLAYCAGTGGSCLVIGSAAGVAAMGLEHIHFLWYAKKIAPWALLGYFAGVAVFILQHWLMGMAGFGTAAGH
jgi:Na+/H+ antiporter NhaD/arsenite permease-like protein